MFYLKIILTLQHLFKPALNLCTVLYTCQSDPNSTNDFAKFYLCVN